MNILHLGNPYFVHDFRELGHEVVHVSFDGSGEVRLDTYPVGLRDITARLPPAWRPDLVLLGDQSAFPRVIGLEFLDVPLVWYAIDAHLHLSWHMQYAAVFDLVFVAQRDFVRCYRADADRQVVEWAPLFCDTRLDRRLGLPRDIPLSFVGTLNAQWNPDRVRLLEALRRRMPIHVQSGAYLDPFNRSQLVLNQSVANDVNFRTFQAMACGALLLTERVGNGLGDLFQEGRHYLGYDRGQVDQIVERVEYYRSRPAEREAIADAGYRQVLAAHTSRHRAERILESLARCDLSAMIEMRRARLLEVQSCLATVYDMAWRRYLQAAMRHEPGSSAFGQLCLVARRYRGLAEMIRGEFDRLIESAAPAPVPRAS